MEQANKDVQTKEDAAPIDNSTFPEFSIDDFLNAVRYGSKTHVSYILSKDSSLVHKLDPQGFSAMHWAAKRGDYDMMACLENAGCRLDTQASYETRMLPIHWAASEGKVPAIKFLLDFRQDIDARDSNECTPLIIAAQYGHPNACIYLIKNGADMELKDQNGDTALHWAAYKGYDQIVGLLLYFAPLQLNQQDTFGQTPLHLAALRDKFQVAQYLISEYEADYNSKDKNGFTPLQLAVKKGQIKAEWTIRVATSHNSIDLLWKMGIKRLNNPTIARLYFIGMNENDCACWVWRNSLWSNIFASYYLVWFATSNVMVNYAPLHVLNMLILFTWWILFYACLLLPPAFAYKECPEGLNRIYQPTVESSTSSSSNSKSVVGSSGSNTKTASKGKNLYSEAIDLIGSDAFLNTMSIPNLCHSCHIQRPLRSKHCTKENKCVLKFDHFCPYVYATVSRDNYKYFIAILFMHMAAYSTFMVTSTIYWRSAPLSWGYIIFMIYSSFMAMLILMLLKYHMKILCKNVTTNEDINGFRYPHFRDEFNNWNNPFDKGSPWKNAIDGLFPSTELYYTREDVCSSKKRRSTSSGMLSSKENDPAEAGHDADEKEGFFEQTRPKLLV